MQDGARRAGKFGGTVEAVVKEVPSPADGIVGQGWPKEEAEGGVTI
jgi:hypothetical protein